MEKKKKKTPNSTKMYSTVVYTDITNGFFAILYLTVVLMLIWLIFRLCIDRKHLGMFPLLDNYESAKTPMEAPLDGCIMKLLTVDTREN
jgi:hypothetical protein